MQSIYISLSLPKLNAIITFPLSVRFWWAYWVKNSNGWNGMNANAPTLYISEALKSFDWGQLLKNEIARKRREREWNVSFINVEIFIFEMSNSLGLKLMEFWLSERGIYS